MNQTKNGIISELHIYPVKSLRGISVPSAELTPKGLKWDRFWMVVNDDGLFMSQRNLPEMATISTKLNAHRLLLSHPDFGEVEIPLEYAGDTKKVAKVWQSECQVLDEGSVVSNWLTLVLGKFRGQQLHLVRMDPTSDRVISDKHTNGEAHYTNFADGYPFLVTNTASLDVLNNVLSTQSEQLVSMDRFRGNIVIDQAAAFSEHNYSYLELTNKQKLHLCKPCERCKVIGINQKSGLSVSSKQPLNSLFKMDHVEAKGAYFGHNGVLINESSINEVVVLTVGQSVMFSASAEL